jgi:hypothetical protein
MDWAVDEEDEEAGMGFSDLAMDAIALSRVYEEEISDALASEVFPHSVFPYTYIGRNVSIETSHREAAWWVVRHWARAGKPPMNPEHFLYTMKRAGLVVVPNNVFIYKQYGNLGEISWVR